MKEGPQSDGYLADLMRSAQDGDGAAYAVLLETITPTVRRLVHRRVSSFQRQEVEDIVQDILVCLHVARASYDPKRPFLPWLMGIARIRIFDAARRGARRAARELIVANVPETNADAELNLSEDSFRDPEALRKAIQGLPDGQRLAIELLKLREMSLKEAAAATGMSIGALKVASHRGVAMLRQLLSPPHQSEIE